MNKKYEFYPFQKKKGKFRNTGPVISIKKQFVGGELLGPLGREEVPTSVPTQPHFLFYYVGFWFVNVNLFRRFIKGSI